VSWVEVYERILNRQPALDLTRDGCAVTAIMIARDGGRICTISRAPTRAA
jgi:hypothetical protein